MVKVKMPRIKLTNTKPLKMLLSLTLLNDNVLTKKVLVRKTSSKPTWTDQANMSTWENEWNNTHLSLKCSFKEKTKQTHPPLYYRNVTLKGRNSETLKFMILQTHSSRALRLLKEQQRTHTHDFTTYFLTDERVCDVCCPTTVLLIPLTWISYSAGLTPKIFVYTKSDIECEKNLKMFCFTSWP